MQQAYMQHAYRGAAHKLELIIHSSNTSWREMITLDSNSEHEYNNTGGGAAANMGSTCAAAANMGSIAIVNMAAHVQ